MADEVTAWPMPKTEILPWYKAKLKLVRAKYPDTNRVAHPKTREFAGLFQQEDAYNLITTWLADEDID